MSLKLKPISKQVIVITGASSGIGLVTARMAAERGACVVLAARNAEALQELEDEICQRGGSAIAVPTDVSKRDQVEALARAAVAKYGRIDTWVNNAGLSIVGRLRDISEDDLRTLFDINFWGLVYGSLTAASYLEKEGGAIVNLGSIASDVALPLQGMYAATKHAVKGFTDALRMELEEEKLPISLTLIKPASIDTPFPQHARNYMPREPRLPDPVYPPDEVGRAILYAAEHKCRDINVGGAGKVMTTAASVMPRVFDWVGERYLMQQQQRNEPARDTVGALTGPGRDGRVRGSHPGMVLNSSLYTRAVTHPVATGAILASVGFATAALLGTFRPRQ